MSSDFESNPDPFHWPTSFTRQDRRRFESILRKTIKGLGVDVTGEMPDLLVDGEGQLSLRNLVVECSEMPCHRWADYVRWWFETLLSTTRFATEAPAMSIDVVEASLRIRLLPDDGVHDFVVRRPSLPGLTAALFLARPGAGHTVTAEMLDCWGLDREAAFQLGRTNSIEREEVSSHRRGDLVLLDGPSIYSSTQALTIAELDDCVPMVLGIPSRHSMLVGRLDRFGLMIGDVAAKSFMEYQRAAGPTTGNVWFVDPATFGEWGEGAELITVEVWFEDRANRHDDFDDGLRCRLGQGPRLKEFLEAAASAA